MSVVTFERADLESLTGKKLKDSDYTDKIPMMGVTTESLTTESASFEIFPNRPDMLSVEGFARALKAFMNGADGKKYGVTKARLEIKVDKSVSSVRPYVACAIVRNIKLTDSVLKSLMQFQEKIHETFGRKRERVAVGIHDASKIRFPLRYAAYGPDEISFVPLDMKGTLSLAQILQRHPKGLDHGWVLDGKKGLPVITDSKNDVLSFPPIINGELTRVTDRSKSLFIDVTGTSKHYINKTLNIICSSLMDRGADVEAVKIVYPGKTEITPDTAAQKIGVSMDYLNGLLDTDLKEGELKPVLSRMGIAFSNGVASIPFYRTDVMHQIDVVEDAAISIGYGKFEPRIPKIPTMAVRDELQERCSVIREIMAGLGMEETVSFVLTNNERQFKMMNAPVEGCASIMNPKTQDYTACRKYVVPSLMAVLSDNKHNEYPQRIFEIGDCVSLSKTETGASNIRKIAVALCHKDADINEIKSVLETFMRLYGMNYALKNSSHPSMIKGRCGDILVNGGKIGFIGEVDPAVLGNWYLENPVAVFEMLV